MKIKISEYTGDGYRHKETHVDDAIQDKLDMGSRGQFIGRLVDTLVNKGLLTEQDINHIFCGEVEIKFLDTVSFR